MSLQTGRIASNLSVGGISFGSTIVRQAEGNISHSVPLPAGVAGAISGSGGVDGLATGHGFTGADVVSVHWTDAGVAKSRRGLVVATASTNEITFEVSPAGEGDSLPAEDTPVVVSKQIEIVTGFDADLLEIIAVKSTRNAAVDIRDSGGSKLLLDLVTEEAWWWVSNQGVDNPLDSNVVESILASNASTTASVLYIGVLYQSVE